MACQILESGLHQLIVAITFGETHVTAFHVDSIILNVTSPNETAIGMMTRV